MTAKPACIPVVADLAREEVEDRAVQTLRVRPVGARRRRPSGPSGRLRTATATRVTVSACDERLAREAAWRVRTTATAAARRGTAAAIASVSATLGCVSASRPPDGHGRRGRQVTWRPQGEDESENAREQATATALATMPLGPTARYSGRLTPARTAPPTTPTPGAEPGTSHGRAG